MIGMLPREMPLSTRIVAESLDNLTTCTSGNDFINLRTFANNPTILHNPRKRSRTGETTVWISAADKDQSKIPKFTYILIERVVSLPVMNTLYKDLKERGISVNKDTEEFLNVANLLWHSSDLKLDLEKMRLMR